jgi:sugar lactone lactonase YvrE
MKLFFVLTVLLSFLRKAFSDETAPVVSTLYSGPVSPVGIWSDANGIIYGCETGFHSVFKITSDGVKTDFAGTRGTAGVISEGVLALSALFNSPRAVWGDGQFLYITDSVNNRIRRVSWTTSLVTTIVGGGTGSIITSGSFPGTSVALTLPNAIAGSSNGKIYFADFDHVFVLDTVTGLVGVVSFLAGGGDRIGTFAYGRHMSFSDIQGLAVDPKNKYLFVADSGNQVVRKIDLRSGHAIIFAGRVRKEDFDLPSKPFENGEAAYKVKFGNPSSVWVGGDGSVFIADSLYHTISVVRHNKIYLFAGKWSSGAISNTLMTGPANQVQIEASHIFGDSSKGMLYLCDGTRGGIQRISPLNVNVYAPTATPTVPPTKSPTVIPTVVPTAKPIVKPTRNPTERPTSQPSGQPSYQPSSQPTSMPTVAPPPLISKTHLDLALATPAGVWADAHGNVFAALANIIYKQSSDEVVSNFAGIEGEPGSSGDDGTATEAQLKYPKGLWGDNDNLYICVNRCIRAVNFTTNIITTIAGGGEKNEIGTDPQPAKDVYFDAMSIWGDGKGNLYILTDSQLLLYVIADETIQVFAYSDTGASKTGADGEPVDFLDMRAGLSLAHMTGDASRNCLYISEPYNLPFDFIGVVRKLDLSSKTATIFAGTFGHGSNDQYTDGALATEVKFSGNGPAGIWAATDGTVFVADYGTKVISAINPNTNEIRWFAGTWNDAGDAVGSAVEDENNELNMDGLPKLGKIAPGYLTGSSQSNSLYVTDIQHLAVRKVSPLFTSPPPPVISKTSLQISSKNPAGLWADPHGNVYAVIWAGETGHQIYKQSSDEVVSVFAGVEDDMGFSGDDGPATEAQLKNPKGLWGDSENLYICDTDNGRVRAVNFATNIITTIAGGGEKKVIGTDPQPAKDVHLDEVYSIWGDGKGNLYILTNSQVFLYVIDVKTIQLFAYSDFGAKKTGADGESVDFLDLRKGFYLRHMTGDASRNCLYVSEPYGWVLQGAYIIRKLDLTSKTATIFAGTYGFSNYQQYTDGALATEVRFSASLAGLWVAYDGTVFVADPGTASISAINPNTNKIRWFAGTWYDPGYSVDFPDLDVNNELHMNGPAKLGKIYPTYLTGNSQSNTLYVVDDTASAVRKISPLFISPTPPALPGGRRKLEEKKVIPSLHLPKGNVHLRGSA